MAKKYNNNFFFFFNFINFDKFITFLSYCLFLLNNILTVRNSDQTHKKHMTLLSCFSRGFLPVKYKLLIYGRGSWRQIFV